MNDEEKLDSTFRGLAKKLGLSTSQLFGIIRVAITGRTASPPLFATMAVLGKARCLKRIQTALQRLTL